MVSGCKKPGSYPQNNKNCISSRKYLDDIVFVCIRGPNNYGMQEMLHVDYIISDVKFREKISDL